MRRDVDKLKNERSPGNDTGTPGKEVSANNVFQNRRFATGLGSNDDDLRQVQGVGANGVEHKVLELVDQGDQVFERSHGDVR